MACYSTKNTSLSQSNELSHRHTCTKISLTNYNNIPCLKLQIGYILRYLQEIMISNQLDIQIKTADSLLEITDLENRSLIMLNLWRNSG